jgi:serine/threonine protein kinase
MTYSDNTTPTRLQGIDDLQQIGRTVAHSVWGEIALTNQERITTRDMSGSGGGRVYFVSMENAEPPIVVLKVLSKQSASPLTFERFNAAIKVFRERGLAADLLAAGEGWYIDAYAGESCAGDYFHFDHTLAPASALAKLVAEFHAVPTDWYEPHRAEVIAQDPVIGSILDKQPAYSHCWNPFGFGLENGMVFIGGGYPSPDTARDIMDRQVDSGVFSKFLEAECFHPRSEAGRRVVTCHMDIKPDNILINGTGLVAIDFEFSCVGPAVNDLGHMMIFWLGSQLKAYEFRHAFLTEYLEAVHLPSDDKMVRELMLDVEINTLCTFTGLLSNIYDEQVPLLRGKPHPTAGDGCITSDSPTGLEIIDQLSEAIESIYASPDLIDEVLRNGIVPTLYARKAGSDSLWKFMDEMKENNMLRLFGIMPSN